MSEGNSKPKKYRDFSATPPDVLRAFCEALYAITEAARRKRRKGGE